MTPQPLSEWVRRHTIADEMLWKGSALRQVKFVQDELAPLVLLRKQHYNPEDHVMVISTHRSKSIDLPVYELRNDEVGVVFTLRDNFYNWKVSVDSRQPIKADFTGLCYLDPPIQPEYTGDSLSSVYFEGFPADRIYSYYNNGDYCHWSAELYNRQGIFMLIFLCMRALGHIKPFKYLTRAEHKAQLDEEQKEYEELRKQWDREREAKGITLTEGKAGS